MSSLESKNYVATLEDVARITREVLEAHKLRTGGVATYLRALIATTQAELGLNPRQRAAGATGKLNAEETAEQLAALEKVGERFYGAVVKAAKEKIEGPDRGGAILHKRTGFSRSSLSTVRTWVRRGNDITSLVAARVTKAALYVKGKRGKSVKVLGNQAQRFGTRLEETLATFAAADRDAAQAQWERLRAQLDRVFRRGNGGSRLVRTGRTTHQPSP